MKKTRNLGKQVLIILYAMLMLLLASYASKTEEIGFSGTWKLDHIVIDGSSFTVSELEAIGEDHGHARIVLKDGGKAYLSDEYGGEIVEWNETENGIQLGEKSFTLKDGFLCGELYDDMWCFRKVSDSQIIENTEEGESKKEETVAIEPKMDMERPKIEETTATVFSADAVPADPNTYIAEEFEFILYSDGSIELTKYVGREDAVDIHEEVGGYPVSRIGAGAFENTDIKTIYMWAKPILIGEAAFRNCKELESIDIPSTITAIPDNAFENCAALEKAYIWGNLTSIGKAAFRNCTSLESIDISSSCTEIGESAFENCIAMENVYFFGSHIIGNCAFKNCSSLESVDIPSGTSAVGDSAFEGCTSLKTVYAWSDSVKYGTNVFANCLNLKELPKGVVVIKQKNETQVDGTEADAALTDGMRPEFKEAMDAYEAFYKEYCDLLQKYTKNPTDITILGQYTNMLTKVDEVNKAFEKWDESDLNSEELKYYLDVNNRVLKMLVDVAGNS